MSYSVSESVIIIGNTNTKDNHTFDNLYLEDVDFSYQNYKNVNFKGANLINANLQFAIFENANLSPMMSEFYMSSKKISNEKVKEQLDLKLKYRSYKEGLESMFLE